MVHGVDKTAPHCDRATPLLLAVQKGSGPRGSGTFVPEHDADVTARGHDGATPLHLAAQRGNVDLVRLLLEHGVDAAARNHDATPLHLVVRKEM